MEMLYPHPDLEAELALRRERIQTAMRAGNRRGSWFTWRRGRRPR